MGRRLSRAPLLRRIRSDGQQRQAGGRARQRPLFPLFNNKGCVSDFKRKTGRSRGVARASFGADSEPARLPAV